jgi:hypothetical protein
MHRTSFKIVLLGSDVQWRGSITRSWIGVSAELIHKALHKRHVAHLSSDKQGCYSISELGSVDIGTELLHHASENIKTHSIQYEIDERPRAAHTDTLSPQSPKFVDVAPLAGAEDRILGDLHSW